MINRYKGQSKPLIQVKNFSYSFDKDTLNPAVKDVNFSLYPNEFIGIIGESGSGKSVTAKAILQLNTSGGFAHEEGEILYGETNLLKLSEEQIRKIRGREIAIVFQDPMTYLNPTATIGSQIDETLAHHFPHFSHADIYTKTLDLLKLVELSNAEMIYRQYPHELSGGMRQRVMIAIALAPNPRVFIADEITTALDVTIQHEILNLLKRLQATLAMSIIFITHDLSIISTFASRVIVKYQGSIVESGNSKDVCKAPLHHYTKALIGSIPRLSMDKNSRLEVMYVLRETTKTGCIFYNKCCYAQEICKSFSPLISEEKQRSVLCHFPLKEVETDKEIVCQISLS